MRSTWRIERRSGLVWTKLGTYPTNGIYSRPSTQNGQQSCAKTATFLLHRATKAEEGLQTVDLVVDLLRTLASSFSPAKLFLSCIVSCLSLQWSNAILTTKLPTYREKNVRFSFNTQVYSTLGQFT